MNAFFRIGEILFGIILFPIFLILGLIIGICKVYSIYNESAEKAFYKTKD